MNECPTLADINSWVLLVEVFEKQTSKAEDSAFKEAEPFLESHRR